MSIIVASVAALVTVWVSREEQIPVAYALPAVLIAFGAVLWIWNLTGEKLTIENRLIVDMADIKGVRFECSACSAALSLRPQDWTQTLMSCPGCHMAWMQPDSPQGRTLHELSVSLRGAMAIAKTLGFRLRLELDRPTTP